MHKFNLCIPISFRAPLQNYVKNNNNNNNKTKQNKKKTQSLKKLGNGECNLDKIELHILNKKKWNLCVKNLEWIFF